MASGSKPQKEETAEEIMARKRMIMSGTQAGNLHSYEPGTEIMMNRDGSNGFRMDNSGDPSSIFKWNEKTGDYRSNGGGIMSVAEIPQAQAAAAEPDKGPKKKKKKKPETDKVVYPGGPTIDTTPGGGYGSWQDRINMGNYQPVTPNTQLNPLVDANNWMYTPDPQYGVINNPGIYVNNPKPKGLI